MAQRRESSARFEVVEAAHQRARVGHNQRADRGQRGLPVLRYSERPGKTVLRRAEARRYYVHFVYM